jgi:osmotically-inducible protein OsmY
MARLPGGLVDEKSSCWSRLEWMRKMGTLGGAVPEGVEAMAEDGDITLTGFVRTSTEREAAEVMVAELTGVRRVRNDIQIRGLEQA